MENTEQQIEHYLLPYNEALSNLVQELRSCIKEQTQPSIELVFDTYNSLNIGYGFTEKAWDCYCGIIVYRKHLNLSFPSGATLTDPEGILQGKGAKVRHLKIKSLADIKEPLVSAILGEARTNAFSALADPPSSTTCRTVIKESSGKKRRPTRK